MKTKKILIVEDEERMLQMLVEKFRESGFEVLQARDGAEGIQLALKQQPDIMLLDIVMPNVDGLAVMKQLRGDANGKDMPVILLTNLQINDKLLRNIEEYRPAYYLVKADWKLQDIVIKVQEALNM